MHSAISTKRYFYIFARVREARTRGSFDGFKSVGFIGVIVIILGCVGDLSAESWNSIHPLISRKTDVERILGRCPDNQGTSRCRYPVEDKNILIEYSVGDSCSETESVWKVPNGTVLRITIHQKDGGILLKNLPYDLKDFRYEEDPELPGFEHYTQAKKGLALEVSGGFVQSLYYGPSAPDRRRFACTNKSKRRGS